MKGLGVPYKGNKTRIAMKIINSLPPAEYFVDLFAGGCAVTHAAMLSRKYKRFIVNDIDGRGADAFYRAAHGEQVSTEWVSRDEFHEKKLSDSFIAVAWSFNNDMDTYIHGAETEDIKRAIHFAITNNDYAECERLGVNVKPCELPLERLPERRIAITSSIKNMGGTRRAQQLERIEAIQRLETLRDSDELRQLEAVQRLDYSEVEIPKDAVVYCDIPYRNTNTGGYEAIDYERFYRWCERQANPVFISEYSMPSERFKVFKSWRVHQTCAGKGAIEVVSENLYVPNEHDRLPFGQLSLFDY